MRKLFLYLALLLSVPSFGQIVANDGTIANFIRNQYTEEGQAVINKMSGLTDPQKTAINRLTGFLVDRGVWYGLDQFVSYAGLGSSANGVIDWVQTNNANGGTNPWGNTTGFTTDGATAAGSFTSGFQPNTMLVKGSENDSWFGTWIKSKTTADGINGSSLFGGFGANANLGWWFQNTTTGIAVRHNVGSSSSSNTYDAGIRADSFYWLARESSTVVRIGKNSGLLDLVSQTSQGLPTAQIWMGARNSNGTRNNFFGADYLLSIAGRWTRADMPVIHFGLENYLQELGVITQKDLYNTTIGQITDQNKVYVYVIFGQSNAAGANAISALPAYLNTTLTNVRVGFRATFVAPLTLQNLQAGVNNNYENLANYGPEMRIGYELGNQYPGKFVICKYAISGTTLQRDNRVGINDWDVASSNELYSDLMTRFLLPTMAAIVAEGKTPVLLGADWMQGEADAGYNFPASCLLGTTANITLSGEQTIDGTLTSSSRVLVKNQTTQSQNGIYISNSGAWTRATDSDVSSELDGSLVDVTAGSTNLNKTFFQTTATPTIGSSNIVFTQIEPALRKSYKTNLYRLFNQILTDVQGAGYSTANVNFTIGRIQNRFSPARPGASRVRTDEVDAGNFKTDNPSAIVNTVTTYDTDDLIQLSDAIHQGPGGQDLRAMRLARWTMKFVN